MAGTDDAATIAVLTVLTVVAGRERIVASGAIPAGAGCDVGLIDHLLRLHLSARRLGCTVRLSGVSQELQELLDLTGLGAVLALETWREAEGVEQPGIDEVDEPRDGPA